MFCSKFCRARDHTISFHYASLNIIVVYPDLILQNENFDFDLKVLWDYILVVRSWIYEWECTEWKKIDSESMDMELKKFAKEMRSK